MGRISKAILAGVVAGTLLLAAAHDAQAGHPLGTEDAGTLGKGNAQVEFNYERAHGSAGNRETAIVNAYTLGFAQRLDFAVNFAYLFGKPDAATESVHGMGDTEATLKYALYEGKGFVPTVGVKAGVALPTGDHDKGFGHGRACGLLTLIADWEIEKVLLHANVGTTVGGRSVGNRDREDAIEATFAVEYPLGQRFTAVGEYQWEKNVGASGPAASELMVGGKVALPGDVTLDAGMRWGTTEASPNVTWLAGITLGFNGGKAESNKPAGDAHPTP